MKAENFNVVIPEGQNKVEVILRELDKQVEKELPVLEPLKLDVEGTITAPYVFLEKRWNAADGQINHERTMLVVSRDEKTIALFINEDDQRYQGKVAGKIELSRQYIAFGLNNEEKEWTPEELGNFFRINRTWFESKEENMRLVTLLKSFKAKVSVDVERMTKDNGSVSDCYRQAVDSNLPEQFFIQIPIFKGTQPEKIAVEVIASVSGRDVTLELISADAAAIEEEVRDKLIDNELEKIRELAPEIPIIEM